MTLRRLLCLTVIILLALSSCAAAPALTVESPDGELVCELYATDGSVRRIRVLHDGKKSAQYSVRGACSEDDGLGFEFIDLNFDGQYDMRLLVSDGVHRKYRCWLRRSDNGEFVKNAKLDALLDPVADEQSKRITASYNTHTVEPAVGDDPEAYIDEQGSVTYAWRQGALVAVMRECTTYYSESDIYCVALWEINTDGELEATSERWLSLEQYARAGYQPLK